MRGLLMVIVLWVVTQNTKAQNAIVRCNNKLIEVVMEDVFSPPLASRVHVYPNLAAYEIARLQNASKFPSIFENVQQEKLSQPSQKIDYELGSIMAYCALAKELVYSEYMITDFLNAEINNWFKKNNDSTLYKTTKEYVTQVSQKISAYLKKDNYNYTRTLMRYVVVDTPGSWQPTGPEYANALEPNWPLMRSFVFNETNKIKAIPNVPYSEKKNSLYFKNAKKLYKNSVKEDSLHKLIANYWDDNPNILKSGGHLSYFVHKINPVGHWLKIAGQAIAQKNIDNVSATQLFALLSIAQYEAIISCWTEKYSSNAVRPETYINKFIAPKWRSYIETPPFPEYTSGHSCISGASATVLTQFVPQPYSFIDSSEMYINLPARKFNSFYDAAEEASISRFYGGIHYMPSLTNGVIQGKQVASFILQKLVFTKHE